MIQRVSTNMIIREMDSVELLEYLTNIWRNKYNKNTKEFLINEKSTIQKCSVTYKQLTGNLILMEISDEFTFDYNNLVEVAQSGRAVV
jgi:hypothetical protein